MKVLLLFVFLSLPFTTIVHAEYRVFVLKISKSNPEKGQPDISRTLQSTLDPVQYKDLYSVQSDEKVEYIDTWRCKGRTGDFQDFCLKPQGPAKAPASVANDSANQSETSPQKAQIPAPPVSNQNSP